jgi:carbamate kinase
MAAAKGTVVALGGNAIIKEGEQGTVPQQFEHTLETMRFVAQLVEAGESRLIVTHGNGPQMGSMMLRSELATTVLPPLPMATCVADLQGGMGYMIQQTLTQALVERATRRPVVTLITQVEIDPDDPGFRTPTKPIGRFMSEADARVAASERGWFVGSDAGRGWRRMVASPRPQRVVELDAVRAVLDAGGIPVAVGGGGIPVVRRAEGVYEGVDAVIDKDLASALLGAALGSERLIILTGVDEVMVGFGKPGARALREVNAAEMRRHLEAGEFAPGSMRPKIEAALLFLERGGAHVIITSPERCIEGVRGTRGTHITAE